jgi:integrase/recombinase XerC
MRTLTANDVKKLISALRLRDLQAKAFIDLAFHTALRPAELCDLQWSDIEGGRVHVRCGKGSRARTVALVPTYGYLEAWKQQSGGVGYVFCTAKGKQWQTSHVRRLFTRLSEKTGLDAHPHGMRHAAALAIWHATKDLGAVSRQLGHVRLATTDVYLNGRGANEELDVVAALSF